MIPRLRVTSERKRILLDSLDQRIKVLRSAHYMCKKDKGLAMLRLTMRKQLRASKKLYKRIQLL